MTFLISSCNVDFMGKFPTRIQNNYVTNKGNIFIDKEKFLVILPTLNVQSHHDASITQPGNSM